MLVAHVARDMFLIFDYWFYFRLCELLDGTVVVQLVKLFDVVIDLVHGDETMIVLVDHAENRLVLLFVNCELLLHLFCMRVRQQPLLRLLAIRLGRVLLKRGTGGVCGRHVCVYKLNFKL